MVSPAPHPATASSMRRRARARAFALLILIGLACAGRAHAAPRPEARLASLTDRFVRGWLERHPHLATRLGVHTWDRQLRPITQSTVIEDDAWLAQLQAGLDSLPRATLDPAAALERDLLAARLARERFELDEVRGWERNPNTYLDLVAGSLQSLFQREFAPAQTRLRAVIGRLGAVPEVLRAA